MAEKRTKTISKSKPATIAPKRVVDTDAARHERIAQRAYERYVARGCVDGFAFEDWIAAEAES